MRQLATMCAVLGFFALAFVGWFSGVPVFICAVRALSGAAVLYVVAGLAGTVAVRIIADAAVRAQVDHAHNDKSES